jgi:hypothetical protein
MEEGHKVPLLLEFLFGEVPQGCGINFETVPQWDLSRRSAG